MKSAITLAQVPEAKAGPFVFHQPLPEGFSLAAELGFDAVELFLPGPDFIGVDEVKAMASAHHASPQPDWSNTAAVPSFTLCTALRPFNPL